MKAATLFSGIGAPEQAMPSWDWRWCAEREPFPSAVLAHRHPSIVNIGDVTADDFLERAETYGRPDIVVFGSPCQSFSVAGRRLGLDDPRGNLALVALGIVARLEPAWFVFENVPGLLSSAKGRDFGLFLRAVDDIGYSVCWRVLDAQYAGLAQRRQRVFAVGHLGARWQYPAAVLFEPDRLSGHPPSREEAREDIAACPRGQSQSSHREDSDTFVVTSTRERARALTGSNQRIDYETETLVAHSLRADGFDASEDGTGRGTPLVAVADPNQVTSKANRSRPTPELSHTLPARPNAPIAFSAVAFNWQSGGDARGLKAQAQALSRSQVPAVLAVQEAQTGVRAYSTAGALRANGPGHDPVGTRVWASSGVRRLTPRECERLQGFPDDYTLVPYRGKPAKDGPRYKAIGNSMAVPVVRWILERIDKLDAWKREQERVA